MSEGFIWSGISLTALIPFQTLTNLLNNYGFIAVILFVMIENSGIPFPGETLLLLAAFTAGADPHSRLLIPFVIAALLWAQLPETILAITSGEPEVELLSCVSANTCS